MAKQVQALFIEEWLKTICHGSSETSSSNSSSQTARAIIQAWADLRESLQSQAFHPHHFQSLETLVNSGISLYVADPQVKLILSILSAPSLSLPLESYPIFFRLLYIWVRKSSKPSPVLIDSAIEVLSQLFSSQIANSKPPSFFTEGILLLGAFSFVSSINETSKTRALELLSKLLEEQEVICLSDELIPKYLAGIGYALSSSVNLHFLQMLDSLFGIWNRENGPSNSLSHGLMMLHLVEWLLYNLTSSNSSGKIITFSKEILEDPKPTYASFALVMAAAGALRAYNRSISSGLMHLRVFAEQRIHIVASLLASETKGFTNKFGSKFENNFLLQCISLALARCGSVSYQHPLLLCLASALLTEIFPLSRFYTRILGIDGDVPRLGLNEVIEHLSSVIFKEAGAVTRVFCDQYISADEGSKSEVENLIWNYCQDIYLLHRQTALMLRGNDEEFIAHLDKIAESAFLMVVVFALTVTKQKLGSGVSRETQLEVSVKILVSFSCLEYFRRMRLSEYMDTIRGVAASVQEDEAACISFINSIPSYDDLTKANDSSRLQKIEYVWSNDDVQTSRILFWLRVIPTCAERLPASVFRKMVAPVMFLYLGHPNEKVSRASHSTFVAFVSSEKDSDGEERDILKEQLVFYYMQRSLEGYPGFTPFEGMASGVAALVRYLPAGSPSAFYCIHCLVEKAGTLCRDLMPREPDLWNDSQAELEPCKKLLELLLRLLSLVDIQVLPSLMKQLAQLVVQLPKDGQNMVLNDLYAQVAESDDVTRKPTLVSWLQSLSYLCSKSATRKEDKPRNAASLWNKGMASLNRVYARL